MCKKCELFNALEREVAAKQALQDAQFDQSDIINNAGGGLRQELTELTSSYWHCVFGTRSPRPPTCMDGKDDPR